MKNEKRFRVDFSEMIGKDKKQVAGYIAKVVEPKAVKRTDEDGRESYSLKTDIPGFHVSDSELEVTPGLFSVCSICTWSGGTLQWNFYLIVVEGDGTAYPVAEYLDSPYTLWVKKAIKVVKQYFNDEELESIEVTPQPKIETSSWGSGLSTLSDDDAKKPNKDDKPKRDISKGSTKSNPPAPKSTDTDLPPYGYAIIYRKNGNKYRECKINRFNKKYIEVTLKGKEIKFLRENGTSSEVSYHAVFNLEKED